MELKHKLFVGINTLEELAQDRAAYFDKEIANQGDDKWWIGKCAGSRDAWIFISATIEAKGEDIMPAFIAENYMFALQDEKQSGLDDESAGHIDGEKDVYKAALRAIGRDDLINLVEDGKFDPEEHLPYISYDNGFGTVYQFKLVDKIPDDSYKVWNIPSNRIDGYLPLCRSSQTQEIIVDKDSLCAIDMRDRPDVVKDLRKAAGVGINNLQSVHEALNGVATTDLAKQQKEWAQVLLPVYEELSGVSNRTLSESAPIAKKHKNRTHER